MPASIPLLVAAEALPRSLRAEPQARRGDFPLKYMLELYAACLTPGGLAGAMLFLIENHIETKQLLFLPWYIPAKRAFQDCIREARRPFRT